MFRKPLAITHLLSSGVITDYHCTSACAHCLEGYLILSYLFSKGIKGLPSYVTKNCSLQSSKTEYAIQCERCFEIQRSLAIDHVTHTKEPQSLGHCLNN